LREDKPLSIEGGDDASRKDLKDAGTSKRDPGNQIAGTARVKKL
jgi:hypothetical protein